ncbi:MAG: 16S rRNA (cytosine(967)-C(5))-methyltransferase RsmB, partial [Christensenellales bacterium]
YSDRPAGERRPYGDRPAGERRPYGDRPAGERRPYSDRPAGERKPYSDRPAGERRPYSDRPAGERRPYSDRPAGERRPYGDKPAGERRPYGDKPAGERRPYSDRPAGERKPYGDRPAGERRFGEGTPAFKQRREAPADKKKASPSRIAALDALLAVSREGAYSGLALDAAIRKRDLSDADRRLCTELFYGCLEKRLYLDHALKPYIRKPFDDRVMEEILRMAAYQAIFLDRIPPNAICGEAVELVRLRGRENLCPVTNAILRSFLRDGAKVELPEDDMERMSIETSTPLWLLKAMVDDLGMEQTRDYLAAKNPYSASIRYNRLRTTKEALEKWLAENDIRTTPGAVDGSYNVIGSGIAGGEAFNRGLYSVIGQSSMIACDAIGVKNGWRVLDSCAAPGGKSCYIAELMSGTGRVVALDIHEHRVKLIDAYAHRLRLDNVRPRVADAAELRDDMFEYFDAAIVDAPCTGLGVLRNKPDIKYNLSERALEELPQLQMKILEAAAAAVKPKGVLVYCTCTVLTAENEDIVAAFLEKHPEFQLTGLESRVPEKLREHVKDGMLRILPDRDDMDGFFIVRMEKTGVRK